MPWNRCTPQEGVTSLHGCVNGVERRQEAQTSDGVPARRDSTCRPGSGVPRRALTTRVLAATHGQPGIRAPGALGCGRALVRMSVALGRHGAVRHAAEEDTGGAGGRAGAERAASSVTVVPSRQRVRRELGKTLSLNGVDNLFGVISSEGNKRTRLDHLRTDSILRPLSPCP